MALVRFWLISSRIERCRSSRGTSAAHIFAKTDLPRMDDARGLDSGIVVCTIHCGRLFAATCGAPRQAKRGNIVSTVELTGWRNSYKIPVDLGATRRLVCGPKFKKFDCCSSIARPSTVSLSSPSLTLRALFSRADIRISLSRIIHGYRYGRVVQPIATALASSPRRGRRRPARSASPGWSSGLQDSGWK